MTAPACVLVTLAARFCIAQHAACLRHACAMLMWPSPAQARAGSEAASDAAQSEEEASESDTGPSEVK